MRQSLRERTRHRGPSSDLRFRLMGRAAVQRRRPSWHLPFSLMGMIAGGAPRFTQRTPRNQIPYIEALFGPRLSWDIFNQLMR